MKPEKKQIEGTMRDTQKIIKVLRRKKLILNKNTKEGIKKTKGRKNHNKENASKN